MLPPLPLLALLACTPEGPGFGGGGLGLPDTGRWRGATDTAEPPFDDEALFDCMDRADIDPFGGTEPPDVQGGYSLAGEVTANDVGLEEGTPTSGWLCLSEQAEDRSISVREESAGGSSLSSWGEIRGHADDFSVWMELASTDPSDPGCTVTLRAVMAGEVQGDDLAFRTASVPVAAEHCEAGVEGSLGSCWATVTQGTRTGGCD